MRSMPFPEAFLARADLTPQIWSSLIGFWQVSLASNEPATSEHTERQKHARRLEIGLEKDVKKKTRGCDNMQPPVFIGGSDPVTCDGTTSRSFRAGRFGQRLDKMSALPALDFFFPLHCARPIFVVFGIN